MMYVRFDNPDILIPIVNQNTTFFKNTLFELYLVEPLNKLSFKAIFALLLTKLIF